MCKIKFRGICTTGNDQNKKRMERALGALGFQHSLSRGRETKLRGEVLHFRGGERFSKCVGKLFIGGAVNELDRALLDDVSDEMETDIHMFRTRVVLVIFRELDGGLVVRKKGGGWDVDVEYLVDEGTKPDGFFHGMGDGDVFGLGSG